MERAASARLSSGTYSASWFVARALWVVLHVFLWTRSAGRAAVDRAFRVSGLAFLEPRRGLSFCARRLRRALEVGSFKTPWADHGERPPPPPDAGGHRERPRRGFVVAVPGGRRARARLGRRRGHPARLAVRPGRVHTCARQRARRAGGSRAVRARVGVGALRAAGVELTRSAAPPATAP